MMDAYKKLTESQKIKNTMLCVGLDTDLAQIPAFLNKEKNPILRFNYEIIEATKDFASSYKINFAFYEQYGAEGWEALKKTIEYIPEDIFIIADAKRGDIGNTSKAYAKACFDYFGADAITLNPYMGYDSVSPFLEYKDKIVFLLALTSNKGSEDFQRIIAEGKPIYRHVIEKSRNWGSGRNLGFVVGATHPDELKEIRQIVPENILLIPGIGAQGGDTEAVLKANNKGLAVINVSRGIIYASNDKYFAESAKNEAEKYAGQLSIK